MARFCTSCGSSVEEALKFCPQCGAQLAAPAVGAQAPAPPIASAARAGAGGVSPGAPPAKGGSSFLKILVIVLGIFAFLTVAGMATCFYVGYKIKKKAEQTFNVGQSGKSVTINTPSGPVTFGEPKRGEAAKAATADVPQYPGSTPIEGGGGVTVGGVAAFASQDYVTSDPVDKVVAFYKEKLGSKATITESEGKAVVIVGTKTGMTTVNIEPDEKTGKTKISIGRVGK